MPITIPNPTAEAFFEAIQQLPTSEIERFEEMMEEMAWRDASARSAAQFFEEEAKRPVSLRFSPSTT